MITIGIDNTLDMGKETLDYIYAISKKHRIKIDHIAPEQPILYKNNKLLSIKSYVQCLDKENKVDLLLVEFKRNSVEKDLYRHVSFDIIVLFDYFLPNKPDLNHKGYFENKILKSFKCKCYLIPDTYNIKGKECITYGWHNDADISLSSAQQSPEGITKLQCCIQTCIPTKKGTFTTPVEFPVWGKTKCTEELLAGAAICVLYGFDTSTFVLENNIYNMV
ncbi:MAG: hypothetical protein K0R69_1938 [Clostridia bacterium]|jgi:hypothetical protein|nr:hypothetical protein [Clostridia bacterium]